MQNTQQAVPVASVTPAFFDLFDAGMRFKFRPLTDEKVLSMSSGEVTSVGLYDARRDRPVIKGLLCETIFGPIKDYECSCGQLRSVQKAGYVCSTCKVLCDRSSLRSELYGHLDMMIHVTNPMTRDLLVKFLGIKLKDLLMVVRGKASVRLQIGLEGHEPQVGDRPQGTCVHESGEYCRLVTFPRPTDDVDLMEIDSGSEALYRLVSQLDTQKTLMLRTDRSSNLYLAQPEFEIKSLFSRMWQVPPADIRPVTISEQNHVDSAFNELYRRVLRHAFQLRFVLENSPEHRSVNSIIVNFSVLIQKAIDGLVKDGATYKKFSSSGSKTRIDSIFDRLREKDGRVRGSVLGKRVDFSGRSSITTAPELPIDVLGVPEKMAIELLRPFVIREIMESELVMYKTAFRWWKTRHERAYAAMARLLKREDAPLILVNRAPSLHRYSVLAMRIATHPGKSLRIPPAICSPLNAD